MIFVRFFNLLISTSFLFFVFLIPFSVFASTGLIDPDAHGTVGVNDNQYAVLYPGGEQINTGDYSTSGVASVANVSVSDSALSGFFFGETTGWIVLNCSNTDSGCSGANGNFKVANDGEGNLSGFAWGEQSGWVSFYCGNSGLLNCATNGNYRVTIGDDGFFSGYAWSQNFGWIKFDCSAEESCTETDWQASSGGSNGGGEVGNEAGDETPSPEPEEDTPVDPEPEEETPVNPEPEEEIPDEEVVEEEPTPAENTENTEDAGGDNSSDNGSFYDSIENVLDNIADIFNGGIETFTSIAGEAQRKIQEVFLNKNISTTTKIVSTAGAVAGVGMTIANMVFLNPTSFAELILIPFRLWSLFLAFLGLRKKPWGVVYDSVTKQPLDPVYVVVKNEKNEDIGTSITDLDGRYGFLLKAGRYIISAGKTNYLFPSKRLFGKTEDDVYKDLYFGETISLVADSSIIAKNIPMDPVAFDWNEFTKKQENLFHFSKKRSQVLHRVANIMFGFGFAVASLALIATPKTYNIVIFAMYILIGIFKKVGISSKSLGSITDKITGLPLSFALVHVISKSTGVEIIKKVADKSGQYLCLIQNGIYIIKIDKKTGPDSYDKAVFSKEVVVSKGYLAEDLSI